MTEDVKKELGEFEQTTAALTALKAEVNALKNDIAATTKENVELKLALVAMGGRVSKLEEKGGAFSNLGARIDHLYQHLLPGHQE